MTRSLRAPWLLLLVTGACATARPTPADAPPGESTVVREAEAFMEGYARDLREGNRAAIIGRYDRRGGYLVGNGRKEFMPLDSIRAIYEGGWGPPATFAWENLSYEPAGPDAVVVTGQFVWGPTGGAAPIRASYTGLLLRQDGQLRIRVEDESFAPRQCPSPPAPLP